MLTDEQRKKIREGVFAELDEKRSELMPIFTEVRKLRNGFYKAAADSKVAAIMTESLKKRELLDKNVLMPKDTVVVFLIVLNQLEKDFLSIYFEQVKLSSQFEVYGPLKGVRNIIGWLIKARAEHYSKIAEVGLLKDGDALKREFQNEWLIRNKIFDDIMYTLGAMEEYLAHEMRFKDGEEADAETECVAKEP